MGGLGNSGFELLPGVLQDGSMGIAASLYLFIWVQNFKKDSNKKKNFLKIFKKLEFSKKMF